ncbi:lipopolysaccharide biosynthesis protein [Lonepinella koalarum]|uniref:lipopolysaccharide biosynthesis protein n=1 Tax=Lonepinella koalarum TaxID=53417 RepID=UPI003F6DB2C1
MVKANRLLKETFIYSIGSFGSKILSFLLVPIYSFFLTKEDLGSYDLFLTTVTLFVPLVSLQISDAAYRWLIDGVKENTDQYKSSKIVTNTFFIIIGMFLIFGIFFAIYLYFYSFQYSSYFLVTLFFSSFFPFLQSIQRGMGNSKGYAASGIILSFLMVILNIILVVLLKLEVKGILLANIIAYIIGSVIIISKLNYFNLIQLNLFEKELCLNMVSYSLPLIPNLMSWWVISSASKFIIENNLGLENNGIYAISSKFSVILIMVNSVLLLPIQDMYLKGEMNSGYFSKIINKFIILEFSLILLLSVTAPVYARYLISSDFYIAWRYMPLIYLGVGFSAIASIIGFVYLNNKQTIRVTVTTLFGGFVALLICYLFIDRYNLQAVSFSFFISYFIVFILRYLDVRHILKVGIKVSVSLLFFILLNLILIYILLNINII